MASIIKAGEVSNLIRETGIRFQKLNAAIYKVILLPFSSTLVSNTSTQIILLAFNSYCKKSKLIFFYTGYISNVANIFFSIQMHWKPVSDYAIYTNNLKRLLRPGSSLIRYLLHTFYCFLNKHVKSNCRLDSNIKCYYALIA